MKTICIIGKSGSGKDTFLRGFDSKKYNIIIPFTTRPMRDNEVNNVDYHFISEGEATVMLETLPTITSSIYEIADGGTWHYFVLSDFVEDKTNIIVTTPSELESIKNNVIKSDKDVMKVINLTTPRTERLIRTLQRTNDDELKVREAIRRYNSDEIDFSKEIINKIKETYETTDIISSCGYYGLDVEGRLACIWGSQEAIEVLEKNFWN